MRDRERERKKERTTRKRNGRGQEVGKYRKKNMLKSGERWEKNKV
jgi:hypothetical protein